MLLYIDVSDGFRFTVSYAHGRSFLSASPPHGTNHGQLDDEDEERRPDHRTNGRRDVSGST